MIASDFERSFERQPEAGRFFSLTKAARSAVGLRLGLARTTPSCGSLARDQYARADLERHGHQALRLQLVKQLHADAMTRAKFGNAIDVAIIGCVDLFATGNFGASHAFCSPCL